MKLSEKIKRILEISPDFQDILLSCGPYDSYLMLLKSEVQDYGQEIVDTIINFCYRFSDFDETEANVDIEELTRIINFRKVSYLPYSRHLMVYPSNVLGDYCVLNLIYLQKFFEEHEKSLLF